MEHAGTIPASVHGLAIATNGVRGVPVRGCLFFSLFRDELLMHS